MCWITSWVPVAHLRPVSTTSSEISEGAASTQMAAARPALLMTHASLPPCAVPWRPGRRGWTVVGGKRE
jgi:hypothetical protein